MAAASPAATLARSSALMSPMSLSHLVPRVGHMWGRAVQLNAGLLGGELPIRFNVSFVAARPPSGDFVSQSLLVGDALVDTAR
jgi:hypothetical protein